jgi:hypothetical protein
MRFETSLNILFASILIDGIMRNMSFSFSVMIIRICFTIQNIKHLVNIQIILYVLQHKKPAPFGGAGRKTVAKQLRICS